MRVHFRPAADGPAAATLTPHASSSRCPGRGYCEPGTEVKLARVEPPAPAPTPKEKAAGAKKGGQKSLKDIFQVRAGRHPVLPHPTPALTTSPTPPCPPQVKPAPKPVNTKAPKAKPNDIVRFTNTRDFEIGRLPSNVTKWLAPLLDQKLVHVEGSVLACKVPLEKIGDEITLSLSVWLRPEAFVQVRRPLKEATDEQAVGWGNLVKETEDEEKMGRRKTGLNTLFETIGVKPTVASAISADGKLNSQPGSPESSRAAGAKARASAKGKEREIAVMEEIEDNGDEEEEGTAIEHKDIDLIYAKYVSPSRRLPRLLGTTC